MSDRTGLFEQVAQAFRDNGMTAAIGAAITFLFALAGAVTRKAFTSEALVRRLEEELRQERKRAEAERVKERERADAARDAERERLEAVRTEDRNTEQAHRERIEKDVRQIRQLLFDAFRKKPPPD